MAHFMITLQESNQKFDVSFGELQYVTVPETKAVYAGSYEVTPKIAEQVLELTKGNIKCLFAFLQTNQKMSHLNHSVF